MATSLLESRPLYAIGTISRLTGIKPDTLRVWERRYGLGASHKSATGRRQYTQADLEHLQLVSALVGTGVRIGEIAACDRKTLQIMLDRNGGGVDVPDKKPGVLFVGVNLCQWLDEHQGCLSHVDARLARLPLEDAAAALAGQVEPPEMLVIGCDSVAQEQVGQVQQLAATLQAQRVLVICGAVSGRSQQALQQQGFRTAAFPPEPGFLAFELARGTVEAASRQGSMHLGDLVTVKPRQIAEAELASAGKRGLDREDLRPGELVELVQRLARLEEDIAAGPVLDWSDAAVSACAYAYAGQARWLMEKALQVVLSSGPGKAQGGELSPKAHLHDAA